MKYCKYITYSVNALGIIASLWLLVILISALIQINPHLTNNIDINRSFIGSSYSFKNWKNSPFKLSYKYKDKMFLLGKAGIYYTNDTLRHLTCFNKGLPSKAYDREVNSFCADSLDNLWIATNSGVYFRTVYDNRWHKYNDLPTNKKYIFISNYKGYMMVYFTPDSVILKDIDQKYAYKPSTGRISYTTRIADIIYDIHSGKFFGEIGKAICNLTIVIGILTILYYLIFLPFPGNEYSLNNLFKRCRYFHIFIISTFSFVILFFFLGLIMLVANTNKKVIIKKTIEPQNIRSVTYDKENELFYFIDDHGMFKYSPETPLKMEYIQTANNATNVNQITILNNGISVVATNNGLFLYNLKTQQGSRLDSNKSLGSIAVNSKTVYNINNQGIYSIGTCTQPFAPTLDVKILDKMSLSELAMLVHSGENSPFLSVKWYHLLNFAFALIIVLLVIYNLTVRFNKKAN